MKACEGSLRRLGTDHIDLYFMHGFDALTPVEETLRGLRARRCIGCDAARLRDVGRGCVGKQLSRRDCRLRKLVGRRFGQTFAVGFRSSYHR